MAIVQSDHGHVALRTIAPGSINLDVALRPKPGTRNRIIELKTP